MQDETERPSWWREYATPIGAIIIGIILLLLSGCISPQNQLLEARLGYNATMVVLVDMAERDEFTKAEMVDIEIARETAWQAMDAWQELIDTNKPIEYIASLFRSAITEMRLRMKEGAR